MQQGLKSGLISHTTRETERTTMESLKIQQRVGQDGILHLDIPVGLPEQDVEVVVIYQPIQVITPDKVSLESLYGICADDPIIIDEDW